MRTRYGVPAWVHQFPDSRRPDYPRAGAKAGSRGAGPRGLFTGERVVDVVILGGGLVGCAVAHACASAKLETVVLERDRIGQGSTGRSAGLLTPEPGPAFRDVADAHGLRSARRVFEAWRRGALDGAALLRRLKIRCALEPQDAIVVIGREEEKRLRKEIEARSAADLDGAWLSSRQIAKLTRLDAAGGIRFRDHFSLDSYRACVGLAAAASSRGARFFERSPATKVRFFAKHVEITTPAGPLRAQTVIVATGSAGAEFAPLRRHFKRRERYVVMTEPVPAAVRRQMAGDDVILHDTHVPPHTVRWAPDDRLVLTGADQDETPAKTRSAVLVQRTGQLMYELLKMYPAISGLQPEYGWEASYGETADGLMYIGPHRNYPRHLFALGGQRDSVTGAFVAARILARALQGDPDKADEVFGWSR